MTKFIRLIRIWLRRRRVLRMVAAAPCSLTGQEAMIERTMYGDNLAFEERQ